MSRTAPAIVSLTITMLLVGCAAQASQPAPAGGTSPTSTAPPAVPDPAADTAIPASTASLAPAATAAARHRRQHAQPPSPAPSPGQAAWCNASAYYDPQLDDYDISVSSNQPGQTGRAMSSGGVQLFQTGPLGAANIVLNAGPGSAVTVAVGAAWCSALIS